jgi:hypothetical protein
MSEIYLVQGNCGEYSDYREWVVCAYRDERKAKKHALLAKQWRQENISYDTPYDVRHKMKNPYDDCSYGTDNDTDWTAYGVEIRSGLPDAPKAQSQQQER